MDTNKNETDSELLAIMDNALDAAFNAGIDKAINYCEQQAQLYKAINPIGYESKAIEAIAKTLLHFKK